MVAPNKKYYRTKGFIFNLDTLMNTDHLVERSWREFAIENGLNQEKLMHQSLLPGISSLTHRIPVGKWAIYSNHNESTIQEKIKQSHLITPDIMSSDYGDTINKLGFKPEQVIVFENSPAGIKAARDSGAIVVACSVTHSFDQLKNASPNTIVHFLTDVDFINLPDGSFDVQVRNTLI